MFQQYNRCSMALVLIVTAAATGGCNSVEQEAKRMSKKLGVPIRVEAEKSDGCLYNQLVSLANELKGLDDGAQAVVRQAIQSSYPEGIVFGKTAMVDADATGTEWAIEQGYTHEYVCGQFRLCTSWVKLRDRFFDDQVVEVGQRPNTQVEKSQSLKIHAEAFLSHTVRSVLKLYAEKDDQDVRQSQGTLFDSVTSGAQLESLRQATSQPSGGRFQDTPGPRLECAPVAKLGELI